ncbi:hypothetical protein ND748_13495 [Frankia sp. AiPs1]|uniref:TAXI family TRAP transporter solute-binding subunit n=1 Tax=Frankia sp. AiPs1 TaxID=573493 RepID=UPI002042DA3C|nr:TAXI family TRAP transporter solute-binding subunit [Frankia sp. AiPs1]MCM3922670.1 hypothetical protein [Frankia sp. AiPs1]
MYISYGNQQSPYKAFAEKLGDQIRAALPEVKHVENPDTDGGADNLYRLEDPGPQFHDPKATRCSIAMTKLNVAVDATYGVYQFNPRPTLAEGPATPRTQNQIPGLQTVGPAFDDLLQIVVRDRNITRLEQLCGRPLSIGLPLSGSRQLTAVFYRAVCGQEMEGGQEKVYEMTLDHGFDLLDAGAVDAVIWVNATPTETIRKKIETHRSHLLDVNVPSYVIDRDGESMTVLDRMNRDWKNFYGPRAGGEYRDQQVVLSHEIPAEDYGTAHDIMTIGVPNGLVVRDSTDATLVAAVARILLSRENRDALTTSLWSADRTHRHQLADVGKYVYDVASSLFCYVPLHPAAADVYRQFGLPPQSCGTT